MAVSLRRVDGQYDFGKSRTNRAEADAVVAEILSRLKDPVLSQLTIGVVTFSMSQQTLIEDLLDNAVRTNPEVEQFFNRETAPRGERVFVKNLENVQGDERDVIMFSVCYGPNVQGKVSMNFGPLNRDGGERRLNVAITRAREEILVISTLVADQIDLSRTRARGVADLRAFLDYADRGYAALREQRLSDPLAECESPFEQQVCNALRDRGYEVHAQVGCSGYRIDLAVVDPDSPGRYLLGIECDGANYHRAKTARDRDRLRENILRDLGWQLHRIWSTDWWEKPAEELARIEAAIEDAKKYSKNSSRAMDHGPALIASASIPPSPSGAEHTSQCRASVRQSLLAEQNLLIYSPYQCSRQLGNIDNFYDFAEDSTILSTIEAIVKHEGPVSLSLLTQRIAELWGIGRIGVRIRERVEQLVEQAKCDQIKSENAVFLWPKGMKPQDFRDFRMPGDTDRSRRDATDIPREEIANGALYILKGQISIPADDLVSETARLFGFLRTGTTVARCINAGVNLLIKRGDAVRQNGMIICQKS